MGPEVLVVTPPVPKIVSNADGGTASAPLTATTYRSPRAHAAATVALVSMLAASSGIPMDLPRLPAPKSRYYHVHLSKGERRGRTHAELQSMRETRLAR